MKAANDVKPLSGSAGFSNGLLHPLFDLNFFVMNGQDNVQKQSGLAIIGLGRVGSTLVRIGLKKGIPVHVVHDSDPESMRHLSVPPGVQLSGNLDDLDQCGIVLFAIPDRSIDDAASHLLSTGKISSGTILAHTSGIHEWNPSLQQLWPAIRFGSLHPLMSFPSDSANVESFFGTGFGLTGASDTRAELTALVKRLGGFPFDLPAGHRPLYHAAAVFASNFPVVLFGIALDLMTYLGIPKTEASMLIAGLMKSAVRNLETNSPLKAISGPASRKDTDTIRKHLTALAVEFPDYAPLYTMMSRMIRNWIETGELHGNPADTPCEKRDPEISPHTSLESAK